MESGITPGSFTRNVRATSRKAGEEEEEDEEEGEEEQGEFQLVSHGKITTLCERGTYCMRPRRASRAECRRSRGCGKG